MSLRFERATVYEGSQLGVEATHLGQLSAWRRTMGKQGVSV